MDPISAIKAYRQAFSVGLGEAKEAVMRHPEWATVAADNQPLHDLIEKVADLDAQ